MSTEAVPPIGTFGLQYRWAGYALGFSIGGFFDGILLHQVLQWHHLLSGLQGGRFDDLRIQILADGFFHLFMYAVGGTGLWLLWRSRAEFGLPKADRLLAANALIGFGTWHGVDAVVSHWVLGIHWIKMDADVPLLWDILWFAVFGVAFVLGGWKLRQAQPESGGRRPTILVTVVLLTVGTGATTLVPLPQADSMSTVVIFLPGTSPARAMAAITSVGGRLIWSDKYDAVWAIDLPEGADTTVLYQNGALMVRNTLLPAACLNWFDKPQIL